MFEKFSIEILNDFIYCMSTSDLKDIYDYSYIIISDKEVSIILAQNKEKNIKA